MHYSYYYYYYYSMRLSQQETRLISKLQLQPKVLLSYLSQVEDHYRPACPYHNSMHGADVAQTVHCLLLLPTLQVHAIRRTAVAIDRSIHCSDSIGWTT